MLENHTSRSLALIHTGSVASVKALELYREAKNAGYQVTSIIPTRSSIPFYIESILRDIYKNNPRKYSKSISFYKNKSELSQYDLQELLSKQTGETYEEIQDILSFGEEDYSGSFGRGVREIQHINRAKVGNILVAPVSAHTLSQIYCGATDSFALETIRAFNPDMGGKVFLAPAMNTGMLYDPAIQKVIRAFLSPNFKKKYTLLPTQEKLLACGDTGDGALLNTVKIFEKMRRF